MYLLKVKYIIFLMDQFCISKTVDKNVHISDVFIKNKLIELSHQENKILNTEVLMENDESMCYLKEKLDFFIKENKIPNILFFGSSNSNKTFLLKYLIESIYKEKIDKCEESSYIMKVNCNRGKGIKFIRDELKFFAKTNVDKVHKSVILYNAEFLTTDAQSALRRCIEIFSKTTRFFILIENKSKLLKPILSRFCDIYVPDSKEKIKDEIYSDYKRIFDKISRQIKSDKENLDLANFFYKNEISSIHLIKYIEFNFPDNLKKYEILLRINYYRNHLIYEELLLFFILNLMRN